MLASGIPCHVTLILVEDVFQTVTLGGGELGTSNESMIVSLLHKPVAAKYILIF